ncbi:MAG: hypothetical protein Q8K43_04570 [Sulfurimicrobium sp.]|nr:hypothetical protein [Sulfurimicrobium sp.]MDO9190792.1 hypothetical protein [Sulfurimicrobium sp.]MDP1703545.1 hypothetical protein [Sulfurimicrobium sp.]MDP1897143.1 hypothetical protein [Sulfurimicrobium sp.]MDP2197882.1 hypothetical protein [Sulfurimicrobium sp.]
MVLSRLYALGLALLLSMGTAHAAPPPTLSLSNGTEVHLRSYPAQGDTVLLWFACDEGHSIHETRAAQALAEKGIETWLPDMLDAHFLPILPSSLKEIPPAEISEIIGLAIKHTGKKIVLVVGGHGALPILEGAHAWQGQASSATRPSLAGAILFYPDLYSVPPAPGVEAEYHPVVTQIKLPMFIYQGQLSPGRWWLEHLKVALSQGGSQVQSLVLPKVRSHFYVRPDATPDENAMAARLPELMLDALKRIEPNPLEAQP